MFSPAKSAEYDGLSVYRPGPYNLNKNVLSCEVAPDPARSYYVSGSDIDGGIDFLPTQFWYAPTNWVAVSHREIRATTPAPCSRAWGATAP